MITWRKMQRFLTALLGLTLLAGLARLGYAGWFSRHWADDYCYSAVARDFGFLGAPRVWYLTEGSRFSTISVVGLLDLLGPVNVQVYPALLLFLFCAGLFALLYRLFPGRNALSWLATALFALAFPYFLFLLAPSRVESFYWRMGSLHYTLPLALLFFLLAALFRPPGTGWRRPVSALFILLAAFLIAGLSETHAALQAVVFFLLLLGGLLPQTPLLRQARWGASAALLGTLFALAVEFASPSTAWRQAAMPPPPDLVTFLGTLLQFTFDFTRDLLRGYPLPLAALLLTSFAVFAALLPAPQGKPGGYLASAALALLAGIGLAASAMAPSVYAGLQYPAPRALQPVVYALLLGLAGASAAFASALRALPRVSRLVPLAVTLALLASLLVVGRQVLRPFPELNTLQTWAARWDIRDAQIRGEVAAGASSVTTREIEVVRGVGDYGPDPTDWVNRCAAAWYKLQKLTALP